MYPPVQLSYANKKVTVKRLALPSDVEEKQTTMERFNS
jgi:hypothetical protein